MGLVRTALPYFGIVIGLTAMDAAVAQQRPQGVPSAPAWYVGAGAGVSYYNMNSQDFNTTTIPSLAGQGIDETGFGWKLFGGYRFSPYFGLEGSYADLGNTSGGVKYSVHSWNVAAVGRIPFASGFVLQGKVGAAFTRAQDFGNHYYRTNLLLGAGVGYDFPSGVGLLAEAEWYGRTGNATGVDPTTGMITGTGRADAFLFSVNSMLRF
jgi:hypothetical protein